jgi:hypothetical protein
MWSARRIFKELTDSEQRKHILSAFWRYGEPASRALALVHLAKALHFREETLRKMPVEKRAELLAARAGQPEFEQFLEAALMQHHTHEKNAMMAAFLDRWQVPHVNGSIEAEDYTPPTAGQVRSTVAELEGTFDRRDIALYLASAGLLMADAWRDATWPVVDEMVEKPLRPVSQ